MSPSLSIPVMYRYATPCGPAGPQTYGVRCGTRSVTVYAVSSTNGKLRSAANYKKGLVTSPRTVQQAASRKSAPMIGRKGPALVRPSTQARMADTALGTVHLG